MELETKENNAKGNLWANIGSLFLLGGVLIYSWPVIGYNSGWFIILGGLLSALGCMQRAKETKRETARLRRLDRMMLIAMLIYIVSGGFMLQESSSWLVLFSVATVIFLYAVLTMDRIRKRKEKE